MSSFFESLIKTLLRSLLAFYSAVLSPLLGGQCRFIPSCSVYARLAIDKYPVGKAIYKIVSRLLRCHPFSKGGVDPV